MYVHYTIFIWDLAVGEALPDNTICHTHIEKGICKYKVLFRNTDCYFATCKVVSFLYRTTLHRIINVVGFFFIRLTFAQLLDCFSL